MAARAPHSADRPATILIADDLESLCRVSATILTRAGYRVVTAASSTEAPAILRAGPEPGSQWSFLPKLFDAQALVGAVRGPLGGSAQG